MRDDDFTNYTHRCAFCKKRFSGNARVWGYWYGSDIVCSYSCMRAMERADRERRDEMATGRPRTVTGEKIAEIVRLRDETEMSFRQIGEKLGVPTSTCSKVYAEAKGGRSRTRSAPARKPEPEPEAQPAPAPIPEPVQLTPQPAPVPIREPVQLTPQPEPAPDLGGVLLTPDEAALVLGYDPKDKRSKADFKNFLRSAKRMGFVRSGPGINTAARYNLQDIRRLKEHDDRRKSEQATSHTPRMDVVEAVRAWLLQGA